MDFLLNILRTVREAVHIQSTWKFVGVCALVGALFFGFLGWLADRQVQEKQRQQNPPAAVQPTPSTEPKTGNARTSGDQSPAVTGNGNTVVVNGPPEPKSKAPK